MTVTLSDVWVSTASVPLVTVAGVLVSTAGPPRVTLAGVTVSTAGDVPPSADTGWWRRVVGVWRPQSTTWLH